jgi:hypothetical protein
MKSKYYVAGYRIMENEYSAVGVSVNSMADALLQLAVNLNFKSTIFALNDRKITDPDFSDLFRMHRDQLKSFPIHEQIIELSFEDRIELESSNHE